MAANSVFQVNCPAAAAVADALNLTLHKSTGPFQIILTNLTQHDKAMDPKAGYDAVVQVQEYNGSSWANLGSAITIKPGGEALASVRSKYTKIKLQTRGVDGSTTVRVDLTHNGKPFLGQVDIASAQNGKAGLSTVGDTTAGFGAVPSPSEWGV
jgi:hypothetical protein